MPLSDARRTELIRTLPPVEVTIERARNYMAVLDLSYPQMAREVGYSHQAVSAFVKGHYGTVAASDLLIREAIETYLQRHPLGAIAEGDQGKPYDTENAQQLRHWFEHAVRNGSMSIGYGPPGSQKTFVAQHLIAEHNNREIAAGTTSRAYLVRCSIEIRPRDLIAKICAELGVPAPGTLQRCLSSIRLTTHNRRIVIVVDEAQLAGIPALEALRELHDVNGFGLLILGSHTLNKLFDTRAAELEQFNSRIEERFELKGVSEASARAIVAAEQPDLPPDLVAEVIASAFVPDIHSRQANKRYCSIRRLFKTLAAFSELQSAQPSTSHAVVNQKESAA